MTWTAPRTWVTGETVSAAQLNTHLRDNLKAISDAWTSYTPAWTGSSGNPSIGNGTIAGRYAQTGKWVRGSIRIRMGSTTTYGSGFFLFSLPVAAFTVGDEAMGWGSVMDASGTNAHYALTAWLNTSTTIGLSDANAINAKSTTPVTFTTNDVISIGFSYEAA